MNIFRCTPDRSLDKQYLRTCAVYKLLKKGRIDKSRAIELLTINDYYGSRKRLIELWLNGPLKNLVS